MTKKELRAAAEKACELLNGPLMSAGSIRFVSNPTETAIYWISPQQPDVSELYHQLPPGRFVEMLDFIRYERTRSGGDISVFRKYPPASSVDELLLKLSAMGLL